MQILHIEAGSRLRQKGKEWAMNMLKWVFVAAAVSAFVAPADGGWVRLTDIPSGAKLLGDGSDLFYLTGTTFRKYDAGTDTWSDAAAPPVSISEPGRRSVYIGGDKFAVETGTSTICIYDVSDNAWTTTPAAPVVIGWMWSQGLAYDPVNDKIIYAWSDGTTSPWVETFQTAAYDVTTGTWGSPYAYRPDGNSWANDTVFVGNKVYTNFTNTGGAIGGIRVYDATQSGNFGTGTWVTTSNFDLANDNSKYDALGYPGPDTAAFVKMMAVLDGKIYITGSDWSNVFIVYDTATDTWSYPQEYYNPDIGGYRTHSMEIADGVLYVQQSSQFWAYVIPEPATIVLLGIGGIGLLARRRRR